MNFEVEDLQTLHAVLDRFCRFLENADVAEESVFDSRLILSELAGNALKYSGGKTFIEGDIVDGKIEVEVYSASKFFPPEKTSLPDSYAEHGRGLYLVDNVGEKRFITSKGGIRVTVRTVYNNGKK